MPISDSLKQETYSCIALHMLPDTNWHFDGKLGQEITCTLSAFPAVFNWQIKKKCWVEKKCRLENCWTQILASPPQKKFSSVIPPPREKTLKPRTRLPRTTKSSGVITQWKPGRVILNGRWAPMHRVLAQIHPWKDTWHLNTIVVPGRLKGWKIAAGWERLLADTWPGLLARRVVSWDSKMKNAPVSVHSILKLSWVAIWNQCFPTDCGQVEAQTLAKKKQCNFFWNPSGLGPDQTFVQCVQKHFGEYKENV